MRRAAEHGVPFRYVAGIVSGVASDVGRVRIGSQEELERYTWRVASVVGGWMTRLFGVHDPDVLARAYRMGHAMQVTNILRDVGEDWREDRIYLPADLMAAHGVDESMVARVAGGVTPVPAAYRNLLEDLMAQADAAYDEAFRALTALPLWYARPVAVAARAYQAIHDEIRRNGYDNGTRRAHTSPLGKLRAGAGAWKELRALRRRGSPRTVEGSPLGAPVPADG
jgi:phytoene synthase